jgi:hypothetical protein
MQEIIKKDFKEFNNALKEYLQIQMDLEMLSLLEKLSRFGAYLYKILVVVYFSLLIVSIVLGALAVWFGKTFDNYFAGVLIAGAGLFVVAVLLILMRKKIAVNSVLSNLSKILLNDQEK